MLFPTQTLKYLPLTSTQRAKFGDRFFYLGHTCFELGHFGCLSKENMISYQFLSAIWRYPFWVQVQGMSATTSRKFNGVPIQQIALAMQSKHNQLVLTLISTCRNPYKFCFYCPATHVMSQVLQAKTVNKWYRGSHAVIRLQTYPKSCIFT